MDFTSIYITMYFTFYPIVNTFITAFKENYNRLNGSFAGIGFGNFKTAVTDNFS